MNKIFEVIKSKENEGFRFNPTSDFYKKIGIKQKRFGQLMRNERSATIDELKAIGLFFGVELTELIG